MVTVIAADPLTPGGASLTTLQDGSFNYLPPADLWGSDSFTYKIWDGQDGFASAKVRVDLDPAVREDMMRRTGRRTVPQIYIDEFHVGGYDDLVALDRSGRLDALLAGAPTPPA